MNRTCDTESKAGSRQIVFEHHWREGFLGEALTIYVDSHGLVNSMEFYSSEFGVVRWSEGVGLRESHSWEAEETHEREGKDCHFPVYLLNGVASDAVTEKILQCVLAHGIFAKTKVELEDGCHGHGSFPLPKLLN